MKALCFLIRGLSPFSVSGLRPIWFLQRLTLASRDPVFPGRKETVNVVGSALVFEGIL